MKAKEYMKRVQDIDAKIANKLAEKARWLEIATSITPKLTGMPTQTGGNGQKMEDAADRRMDIDIQIKRLERQKAEIISTIETLETLHYDVLHKLYVQGKTFQEIADAYKRSYSWATTVHGRALQSLQRVLDERESNAKV